jgi:D-3-phosphoglycerate dehydrogenase
MRILIVSPVAEAAIDELRGSHEVIVAFNAPQDEIKEKIVGCDALVFRSGPDISAEVMSCAPTLRLLVRAGSGLDNLDVDYVQANNIALERIELPGARAVAELAFTLMLNLARQIRTADALLRQGHWAKHQLTGSLLRGKTLGIYGAGNIGTTAGSMGIAWGMDVIGCVENPSAERAEILHNKNIELVDVADLLARADFVSVHLPLKDSTRNIVDADAFAQMKSGAILVNLARGGVVDEVALKEALDTGRLAGAGMDVHEREGEGKISPLAENDNVILTPHIGAGTVDTQREIGETLVQIVAEYSAKVAVANQGRA